MQTTELTNIISTKTLDTKTNRLAKLLLKNITKLNLDSTPPPSERLTKYRYPVVEATKKEPYIWLHEIVPEEDFKTCVYNTKELWYLVYNLSCIFYKQQHTKKGKPVDNYFKKLMHRLRHLAYEDIDYEYASIDGYCIYPDGPLECNMCGEEFYMEKYLDLHTYENH